MQHPLKTSIKERETSPFDLPVKPVTQTGENGWPRESSAGALELLATADRVYSDENNFPSLVLLTDPTWRPPSPSANNNTRVGWGPYLFPIELSAGLGGCWVHWTAD